MKTETTITIATPIVLVAFWYGLRFFELDVIAYAAFSNLFLVCFIMYLDRRDIYGRNILYNALNETYSLICQELRNSSPRESSSNISKKFPSVYSQKQLIIAALRFNRRIFFTRKIAFIMMIANYAFTLWKMNHV